MLTDNPEQLTDAESAVLGRDVAGFTVTAVAALRVGAATVLTDLRILPTLVHVCEEINSPTQAC